MHTVQRLCFLILVLTLIINSNYTQICWGQEQVRPRRGPQIIEPLNIIYSSKAETFNFEMQEVYIFSKDGLYIPAVILKPDGDGPFPAAVFVHGGGGGRGMSYLKDEVINHGMVMERFRNEGYVSVFCDRRGRSVSEWLGDPNEFTDTSDIIAVIQYIKQLPNVSPDKVCIYGGSMGGALTLLAIRAEPVAAAIVNAPAVMSIIGLKDPPGLGKGANVTRPEDIPDSMIDLNLAKTNYGKISAPVMFVVGSADKGHTGIVKKSYEIMKAMGKEVYHDVYPNEPHGFYWGPRRRNDEYNPSDNFRKLLDKAVEFFNRTTK